MEHAIRNVTKIRNERTGETGTFLSQWVNPWTNQIVVNVRVSGLTVSWSAMKVQVL